MTSTLREVQIETIQAYVAFVDGLGASKQRPRWFRGCRDSGHALVPSLYRRAADSVEELSKLESDLLLMFKSRSAPYYTQRPESDWEYLFLMQHFGVPTRLLDWSENSLIALYFATAPRLAQTDAATSDAAVWVLDPTRWNSHALDLAGESGAIMTVDDIDIGYAPRSRVTMNRYPLAMYGTHNSPRIVAQRGAFTIFGADTDPLEGWYVDRNFPADSLLKVTLPASDIEGLRRSLDALGFAETMVYPDLEGLARELKRKFGFEK